MAHSTFDISHNYIDAAAPSTLTKIQADKTRPGMRGVSLPIVPRMIPRKLIGAARKNNEPPKRYL